MVVIDGSGEDDAVSILSARRGQPLIRRAAWPQMCSLGHFYEAVSRWLGLGTYGAGKVMGLAAHGVTPSAIPRAEPTWLTMIDGKMVSAVGTDTRWVYEDVRARWATVIADHAGTDHPAAAHATCTAIRSRSGSRPPHRPRWNPR